MSGVFSMTGYGQGESRDSSRIYGVELRSVNNRFLDINVRVPQDLSALENRIRDVIRRAMARGKIEARVSVDYVSAGGRIFAVDEELATHALNSLGATCRRLGVAFEPNWSVLFEIPGVIQVEKQLADTEQVWNPLADALDQAVGDLVRARAGEGERLAEALRENVAAVAGIISRVEALSQNTVELHREALRQRLSELTSGFGVDEGRLEMEVAVMADRCCVDEEVTRTRSHLVAFGQTLEEGGVVGRKLEFTLQEINREVNTIGSKSSNAEVAMLVVEMKSELEKAREQIQNIE